LVNRTPAKFWSKQSPYDGRTLRRVAEAGITEVDVFFPERDEIGTVLSRTWIGRHPLAA